MILMTVIIYCHDGFLMHIFQGLTTLANTILLLVSVTWTLILILSKMAIFYTFGGFLSLLSTTKVGFLAPIQHFLVLILQPFS